MRFYDWRLDAIRNGQGFHVDVGAFSTPITGGGDGTVIDLDQPELRVNIPTGTTILPIRIDVTAVIPLLAADVDECEILAAADISAVGAAGTSTAETPVNMKTRHTNTSLCTIGSAFTVNQTAEPTLGMELIRNQITGDSQTAAGVMWTSFKVLFIPTYPPMIDGPAALYLYWGGTVAVSGFAQVEWLEYKTSDLA